MNVVVGCDHGGFPYKAAVIAEIVKAGHKAEDLGTDSADPVDYPDYAEAVGRAVQRGVADRGILLCGSGIGAVIAANKITGVRAGIAHEVYSAGQGVEHDDMNVLVLGARVIGQALVPALVAAFLSARFSGEARHLRRLKKVLALESRPTAVDPVPSLFGSKSGKT